jgi:superfamily I DNA/RNA helicase
MAKGIGAGKGECVGSGDYLTIDLAFCQVKQAVRILGSDNSNRTSALIERILLLLNAGAKPADIRVICASSSACLDFMERLRKHPGSGQLDALKEMEITTTRDLAFRVLSTIEAQAAIGRSFCNGRVRLLSAFEMDFILEDLKTLGNRPRRLRELLKFLIRGLTELADEGRGWLISREEQETLAFLRSELGFLQGVIEPELSNLTSKVLRSCDTVREGYVKPHVLIDDYQNLSRASQLLCHLLATDSIAVSADTSVCVEVYDSYPYAEGIEEFLRINPNAETYTLEKREPPLVVETWNWEVPDNEFAEVPKLVGELVAAGEAPESIAVVCFHPQWFNKIMCGLRARGLPARGLYQPLTLKGDVRCLVRSLPLRIVTALRLLVEPYDSMAWRCWIGFGDHLALSGSFVKAREEAEAENPDAVFADVVAQEESWKRGTDFIESCTDKKGRELLDYLTRELSVSNEARIPPVLAPLLGLGEGATPADMLALLERKQFFPQFPTAKGVTIASLEALAGLSFDKIIAVGFVNGLFPLRSYFDPVEGTIDKQKSREEMEKRRLNLLVSAVSDKLVLSYFQRVEQEVAERLQLRSDRIILDKDFIRISMVSLSVHAKELL